MQEFLSLEKVIHIPLDEVFSHIDEEKNKAGGNSVVISRAHLVPHEEEDGAFSPRRETLALLQGVPKNLTYGDHGTIHVQHVPSLSNGEILKIQVDKGEDKHHMMRSTHPSLFQKIYA